MAYANLKTKRIHGAKLHTLTYYHEEGHLNFALVEDQNTTEKVKGSN